MAIPLPPPPPEPKPKVDKPDTQGVKAPQPNISPPAPNGDVNKAAEDQHPARGDTEAAQGFCSAAAHPASRRAWRFQCKPRMSRCPMQTLRELPPRERHCRMASAHRRSPRGRRRLPLLLPAPPMQPATAKWTSPWSACIPTTKGKYRTVRVPGQFAQAPTVGEIATGEVKGGIGVPNLTIHDGGKAVPPPHVDPPRKVVLYADRLRSLPVSTLSVPLHPASRTIPASIEGRFRGRNVYTMVIPIENLPEYSTDWIIWFAEHDSQPGAGAALNVRAPVPLRKFESVEPVPPGARTELRVQLAAVITKEGKLEVRALLRNLTPALESAVLRDVESWEFKPATRDGAPVDIDIVLEIPFSLPPQIAQRSASLTTDPPPVNPLKTNPAEEGTGTTTA